MMSFQRSTTRHRAVRARSGILLSALLIGGIVGGMLSGCTTESGTRQSTMHSLQQSVLDVATRAAAGDATAALVRLAALEASVEENTLAGNLTPTERLRIRSSIALVRTDLAALVPVVTPSPAPSPSPSPSATPGKGNPGKGDNNGNEKGKDG